MYHPGDRYPSPSGQAEGLVRIDKHRACSLCSSTGLGVATGEELKDVSLRDNRMTHIQMWPREYILERKSIIQVDCDREGRG